MTALWTGYMKEHGLVHKVQELSNYGRGQATNGPVVPHNTHGRGQATMESVVPHGTPYGQGPSGLSNYGSG